jgi:hypothetical protein
MSRTITNQAELYASSAFYLQFTNNSSQTERMNARMAELDLSYGEQTKRLDTMAADGKKKLLASSKMQKG